MQLINEQEWKTLPESAQQEVYDFFEFIKQRHARLNIPVYLDQDIENWFSEKAKAKGVDLQSLVNELLRKNISLTQEVTGER